MRTLRGRLLAVLLALLLVLSAVIGLVTVFSLETFLTAKVDTQLVAAANRATEVDGRPPRAFTPPPDFPTGLGFLLVPGQGSQTLGARLVDGDVREASVLDKAGDPQDVPKSVESILTKLPVDGRPNTRDLDGLGSYRLIAVESPSGGDVLITGFPLATVNATVMQLAWVVVAATAAGVLAALLAGAAIVSRTLRPLHRVATTARQVSELPLDRGEVALAERVPHADTDPRSEVGQVGAALNHMLGHIAAALTARQASETRVRQFVADASHELRTPLAAIRGYAEVSRRGHEVVPPDVTYAMRRVESEATRMTALVEDLLLLARLDAGRPLARSSVDLSRLVIDAVSDARAAGPDHTWRLAIPAEPVVATGDPDRLQQAMANLLANARTHTPAGTTVTVALAAPANDGVRLSVRDDGPGIPAALQPTVFERFARGDSSRSRAAGSTGLGLAIVAAVIEAHHGDVHMQSRPGSTVFVICLPPQPFAANDQPDLGATTDSNRRVASHRPVDGPT